MCLKTPFIDYNGRLCMVSAGAASKKAFGIDRVLNPWADMIGTEVIWVAGSNVAECSPITTNYLWQAREQAPGSSSRITRLTPVARLRPVPAGEARPRCGAVCRRAADLDRTRLDRWRLHRRADDRLRRGRRLYRGGRSSGPPPSPGACTNADARGGNVGHGAERLHAARARHRAPLQRRPEHVGSINLVLATGRIGRPHCGYGTIVGQANGQGGREHGQKCDQLPGLRDISNPEHRRYISGVWGIEEGELPGPGVDAYEMFRKIDTGEIKGLIAICFNPKVSLPDNTFVTKCLEAQGFFVAIDFFLNDTARHADILRAARLASRGG